MVNCKTKFVLILLVFVILIQSFLSQFTSTSTCTVLEDCRVSCAGIVHTLSTAVTSDSGSTRRVYTGGGYSFQVPLCGSIPSGYTSTFATYDYMQGSSVGVGKYSSSSWEIGTYGGQQAFKIFFSNGMTCTIPRVGTVYLICHTSYAASSPNIAASEPSSCVYQILAYTIAACASNTIYTLAPTMKPTVSMIPTANPTWIPSSQPSGKPSSQPSGQPSNQPSNQPSHRPSTQPSQQPLRSPTNQPSSHPSRQPTNSPTTEPTQQPTVQPSQQPSQQPSSRPSSLPSVQPSRMPSCQPSRQPSGQPSLQLTALPSYQPSSQPSKQPSKQPSSYPSCQPSQQPSSQPVDRPSSQPSMTPTVSPTIQPSSQPSRQPMSKPSRQPSTQPSIQPIGEPTTQPASQPSRSPTHQSSGHPTSQPTVSPSKQPTTHPSFQPSVQPTQQPSNEPSQQPSVQPSGSPSKQPNGQPSKRPSLQPFALPTCQPTVAPSRQPSLQPSISPTVQPTSQPSKHPSSQPIACPSMQPSSSPINTPSLQPSSQPTCQPTYQPSSQPSDKPSTQPLTQPTHQPVSHPSLQPTNQPTLQPSSQPSCNPSQSLLNRYFFNRSISLHAEVGPYFKIVLPFMFVNPISGDGFEDVTVYNENTENVSNMIVLGGHDELKIFDMHTLIFRGNSSRSVSIVGDVNGDGRDDIIIGVPYASICYILYGTKLGFINMTEGFTVYGAEPSDLTGWSVSGAGDINNDTYADLIIGAPFAPNSDSVLSGVVYILYGGKGLEDIDLKQLNETRGFKLHSSSSQDAFGLTVSGAGDFNGDGVDDVVIGALRMTDYFSGVAFVIYGGQKVENHSINVDTNNGNSVILYGTYHSWFAYSVSGAGDVNGDGYSDVIIGSIPRKGAVGLQKSYLIYGTNKSRVVDISSLAPTHGVIIEGGGVIVSGIGDINSDGFDDVMMDNNIDLSLGSGIVIMQPMVETPSLAPSNALSRGPSMKPTRRLSVCATCNPSVLPTLTQTVVPTLVPSTRPSQPTRLPTASPTNPSLRPSSRPSQPTMLPSLKPSVAVTLEPTTEPSETPTQEDETVLPSDAPTIWPTMLPTHQPTSLSATTGVPTQKPSRLSTLLPTRYPVGRPTVNPTVSPTEVANVMYINREVYTGMTIARDGAVLINYIVNTTEDVRFTNSGLVEMFTIVPNKASRVKIDEFNVSCDIINLEYFESIHSLQTLNMSVVDNGDILFGARHLGAQLIRNASLIIDLGNNQVILLVKISLFMPDEKNFIFSKVSEQPVVALPINKQEKFIVRVVSYVVVGLIVMYFLKIAYVHWQKRRRARLLVPSKFD